MANVLFDYFGNMNIFGAAPNGQVQSLLNNKLITKEAVERANKQSIGSGLITGLASYLAQPKNQGYGDSTPYLAKAFLNANQAAQVPFTNLPNQYAMDTQIAENKLNLENQKINLENQKRTKELENQLLNDPRVKNNPVLRAAVFSKPEKVFEILNKPKPVAEFKAFSQQDDLYKINPDGTQDLIRKGTKKVDNTGLYSNKPQELKNGDFAYLPTPKGMQQGLSAVGTDGKPYTGNLTPKGKGLTEAQSKAFMFGNRMETSNANFESLFDENGEPTYSPSFIASKRNAEKTWVVGELLGAGANLFASDEDQLASQSMRDFINAVLRNESGAAIAEHEFTNAQAQYFPEVNDSKAVRQQKSENRQVAIATMKAAAGQDPEAMKKAEELKTQLTTKKTVKKDTTTKPKARRATVNVNGVSQVIVEDLKSGQWIVESTGKPFVQ